MVRKGTAEDTSYSQYKAINNKEMRKAKPKKRIILPDPRFNDTLVTQFVNNLMYDGKKSTAFTIFYSAMDRINDRAEKEGKKRCRVLEKSTRKHYSFC
jgi:ribosomal protein S7